MRPLFNIAHIHGNSRFVGRTVLCAVIVNGNRVSKARTHKYMEAVARKCWILDVRWVLDSLNAGQMQHEVSAFHYCRHFMR